MPNTCQQKGEPDGKGKVTSRGPSPPAQLRSQKPLLDTESNNDRFPTFSLSLFFFNLALKIKQIWFLHSPDQR